MEKNKLQVSYRPLDTLLAYARNARTHSPEQVAQIAASITEFGWTNPVLIDEAGEIIAGHGRCLAAEQLGYIDVPVIVLAGLTEQKKKAYRLADNKIPLNSGWDDELLYAELSELQAEGFDIELTGFDSDAIDALCKSDCEIKFDEDGDSGGMQISYLAFCGKKIPLSETESSALMKALEDYIEDNGSLFGFAAHLIGGEHAAPGL